MELQIKIYQDKASRVGIKFNTKYAAVKPYQELINKYPKQTFSMWVEIVKDKINMFLQSDETGTKIPYRDLDFKPELMVKLNSLINSGMPVEFVHVYYEANTLLVAKPFHQTTFVTISNIELLGLT